MVSSLPPFKMDLTCFCTLKSRSELHKKDQVVGTALHFIPSSSMEASTHCGNQRCGFVGEMRRCSGCKIRSYCVSLERLT